MTMLTTKQWIFLPVLMAVALTGCGSANSTPDKAAEAYLRALGKGDSASACALSTTLEGAPIRKGTPDYRECVTGMDYFVSRNSGLAVLKNVKITGASLVGEGAVVTSQEMTGVLHPPIARVYLRKIDGRWFVVPGD